MGDLTGHFDSSEFLDKSDGSLIGPSTALLGVLENLRGQSGNQPLRIVSGYRSPAHNAAVGGAAGSRHLVGDAADVEWGFFTVDQALAAGATGVGHCDGFVVHVDCRPGDPVIFEDC